MLRLIALIATLAAAPAVAFETRCGWLSNPTPANWWMTDADGDWYLSLQGAGETPGFFDMRWDGRREWVTQQASYGFGCACMQVEVNRKLRWVERISSFEWIPLSRCYADPALPGR